MTPLAAQAEPPPRPVPTILRHRYNPVLRLISARRTSSGFKKFESILLHPKVSSDQEWRSALKPGRGGAAAGGRRQEQKLKHEVIELALKDKKGDFLVSVNAYASDSIGALRLRIWIDGDQPPSKVGLWANVRGSGKGTDHCLRGEHYSADMDDTETVAKNFIPTDKEEQRWCFTNGFSGGVVRLLEPWGADDLQRGHLSRLALAKQIFQTLATRTVAFAVPANFALVTFKEGKPLVVCAPTSDIFSFKAKIEEIPAGGDTPLWESIKRSAELLEVAGRRHPKALRRIVTLSDGSDSGGGATKLQAAEACAEHHVTLDAISLDKNAALKAVAKSTGGYFFVPPRLRQAVAIPGLEPFVSLHMRPPVVRPRGPLSEALLTSLESVPDDCFDDQVAPARREAPELRGKVLSVASVLQAAADSSAAESTTSAGGTAAPSGLAPAPAGRGGVVSLFLSPSHAQSSKRLLQELRYWASAKPDFAECFVSESNLRFWKILIKGPSETAYADAAFILTAEFPEAYPRVPPSVRFVTRIKHANVNTHGLVCLALLGRDWLADTPMTRVVEAVYSLMISPEASDALDTHLASSSFSADEAGRAQMSALIHAYCAPAREIPFEVLARELAHEMDESSGGGAQAGARRGGR